MHQRLRFPSSADDYLDRPLDFNELLTRNPAATFAVRLAGDSMTGAGIASGAPRRSFAFGATASMC